MSNEEAKQNAIEQAWGDAYDMLFPYMDINGWVRASNLKFYPKSLPFKVQDIVMDGRDWYRPLDLQSINDNNGWNRINNESDLPKKYGEYMWLTKSCNRITFDFDPKDFLNDQYTHWRPIDEIHNPLY